jgi:hypothetical protein
MKAAWLGDTRKVVRPSNGSVIPVRAISIDENLSLAPLAVHGNALKVAAGSDSPIAIRHTGNGIA